MSFNPQNPNGQATSANSEPVVIASDQSAIPVSGTYLSVAVSAGATGPQASTDVGNYKGVSVHVTGVGTGGVVNFQSSNDNTNWVVCPLIESTSNTGQAANSINAAGRLAYGTLPGRYFRLNITGISGGTLTAQVVFTIFSPDLHTSANPAVQSGTWTVGSNSATGSAPPANAFYMGVSDGTNLTGLRTNSANGVTNALAVGPMVHNGTNWDRHAAIINATNSIGTGIAAVGLVAQFDDASPTAITENQFGNVRMSTNRNVYNTIRDAAGNERGANVTAANALVVDGSAVTQPTTIIPTATGGWSVNSQTALSNTKVSIKASAGTLGGYMVYNPNAAVMFIQVFDVADGSITVGTTVPTYVIPIPAASAANIEFTAGINHGTAIGVAATTTATGSSAPGAALTGFFLYK